MDRRRPERTRLDLWWRIVLISQLLIHVAVGYASAQTPGLSEGTQIELARMTIADVTRRVQVIEDQQLDKRLGVQESETTRTTWFVQAILVTQVGQILYPMVRRRRPDPQREADE